MGSFEDVAEYFDDTLKLPVSGKTYTIQGPSAELGLLCQRRWIAMSAATEGQQVTEAERDRIRLDDAEEELFTQRLLGPAWDQMVADGVSFALLQHVGLTVFLWVVAGTESAEEFWQAPKDQAKPKPNRASRRHGGTSSPKASTTS